MDTLITLKKKIRKVLPKNSDIRIEAIDSQGLKTTYYEYIHDIWELDYGLRI
jgi:hypothetical protein